MASEATPNQKSPTYKLLITLLAMTVVAAVAFFLIPEELEEGWIAVLLVASFACALVYAVERILQESGKGDDWLTILSGFAGALSVVSVGLSLALWVRQISLISASCGC